MKALFLGGVAADTAAGIRDELPPGLEVEIVNDPIDRARLPSAAADADILVSNHWRADYPPATKLRLVQSVATGVELFDLAALPKGVAVCNAFGHETAIAEYVVMVMLALHHRLFEISGEFRESGSWRTSWVQGGTPHGEVRGTTLGISRLWTGRTRGGAPCGSVRLPYPRRKSHSPRAAGRRRARLSALPNSTGCCPNATPWRCVRRSAPRPPG